MLIFRRAISALPSSSSSSTSHHATSLITRRCRTNRLLRGLPLLSPHTLLFVRRAASSSSSSSSRSYVSRQMARFFPDHYPKFARPARKIPEFYVARQWQLGKKIFQQKSWWWGRFYSITAAICLTWAIAMDGKDIVLCLFICKKKGEALTTLRI